MSGIVLTSQQQEVLRLTAAGFKGMDLARKVGVQRADTVHKLQRAIRERMELPSGSTNEDMVRVAQKLGLI